MNASRGYYATIQLCPDPSRLEAVNVGALLFCPEKRFLKAAFATDFRRAKKLFGDLDEAFLQLQKEALANRLERGAEFATMENLQEFMDRRASALRFSPARPMQVVNPASELERLFDRLVGKEKPKRSRGARAKTLFTKVLQREHLIDKVRHSLTVELPEIGKILRADFGYKNGRFNVIEPVDFVTEANWFRQASAQAVQGQALHRADHPRLGKMKMVVVGRFGDETAKHSDTVRNILLKHDVKLFPLDRIGPLLADIREHVRA
jgi:hypothetical protein